jgi:SAM-dependent methyltransferase
VIPNYVADLLQPAVSLSGEPGLDERALNTFQRLWASALGDGAPGGLSVLEPACGSANDYRFMSAYGLARLIEYTGFDLCEKNVRNARELFPEGRFAVGNVFAVPAGDRSSDYCIVHDLFEHLSIAGMELAIEELCRVTRTGLTLGFFNLHEGSEHLVRPVDDYHWNALSLPRVRTRLESGGFQVQAVHIDTFLKWRFGCDQTHNKNAYTLLAVRTVSS